MATSIPSRSATFEEFRGLSHRFQRRITVEVTRHIRSRCITLVSLTSRVLPSHASQRSTISLFFRKDTTFMCMAGIGNSPETSGGADATLSLAYGMLSVLFLAAAAVTSTHPEWIVPNATLFKVNPPEQMLPTIQLLLGIQASGYVLASAVAYVLKDSVDHNRYKSETYRRLNTGLKFFALALLGIQMSAMPTLQPPLLWGMLATLLPTVLISTRLHWLMGGGAIHETVRGVWDALKDMLSFKNPASSWYSVAAASCVVLTPWLLLTDHFPLLHGVELVGLTLYAKRLVGALVLLSATVLYVLKNAADRGRIGASTFKALNVAMIAQSAVQGYWLVHFRSEPTSQLVWAVVMAMTVIGAAVYTHQLLRVESA